MTEPRKILCLGDFHLGVEPRRLPEGGDRRALSVAAAWARAVDHALREGIGLVLLSGDLVDRANRLWEALGPLEDGVGRLTEAGVEVCAVAGNHDFDVLDRLTGAVTGDRFHFLGRGGRWERFTWKDEGGAAILHVDGWSFPEQNVSSDPLADHDLEPPADGAPRLGLVHGDLDATVSSTNAPLTRGGLEACAGGALQGWVLGHLHQPRRIDLAGGRWALYPGSLQPRDWTEEGEHGAWVVEVEEGRLSHPRSVPLATVRWETLEIDLTGAADDDAVEGRIASELRDAARELGATGPGAPERLVFRLELTGRTAVSRRELEAIGERIAEGIDLAAGDARARVAEVRVRTRPPIDLADLARGDGPPAMLAELLLGLEAGEVDPGLGRRIDRRIEEVRGMRQYAGLDDRNDRRDREQDSDEGAAPREHLTAAAWSLLEALLDQKRSPGGEAPA